MGVPRIKRDACGERQTRVEGMVVKRGDMLARLIRPISEGVASMFKTQRPVLAAIFAAVLVCPGAAFAQPILGHSHLLLVAKRKPIDKSCLMICEKWGDDGCLKWVTKCKGDTGYPRGGSNTRN